MGYRLTWQDNNLGEEGHRVYRSSAPMDPENLPPPLATLGPDITSYEDTSAIEGVAYYYRVSAFSGDIESVSDEVYADGISAGVQVFTSSGVFTVPEGITSVDVLVLGGGGGGGGQEYGASGATTGPGRGGGGGGGLVVALGVNVTPLSTIPIVVGAGGAGGVATNPPVADSHLSRDGGASSFGDIIALGGGGGGPSLSSGGNAGAPGGSGGGPGFRTSAPGEGTPGQGFRGALRTGGSTNNSGGGSGGGCSEPAPPSSGNAAGPGGRGVDFALIGWEDAVAAGAPAYGGGGGGGGTYLGTTLADQTSHGGGRGGALAFGAGEDGEPGTGGGGGGSGGGTLSHSAPAGKLGGDGGSGIVIVRYPARVPEPDIVPSLIGEAVGVGYYIGNISVGGDEYAIIMAGRAFESPAPLWKDSATDTPGTLSDVDGSANTMAMESDDPSVHHAGMYCMYFRGDGRADWYMPSFEEVRLAWINRAELSALEMDNSGLYYWTSTQDPSNSGRARSFRFSTGSGGVASKTYVGNLTRPVRRIKIN